MSHDPLYHKPNQTNIWWCRIPNPNGGRHLRASTGQSDRQAALVVWRNLCRRAVAAPHNTKDQTSLSAAIDRRIEERKAAGRADGTIDMLTKKARHLNRVLGAETPLSRVDAREVDRYIAVRLAEGAARATIYKELVTLRGTVKLARRQRYECYEVGEIMPLDFSCEYTPKTRALSMIEIGELLETLAPKRAAIAAFILATSATYPSETIDAEVDGTVVHLRGTKTSSRDRYVPVPEFAHEWLKRALPWMPFEPWRNVRRDLINAALKLSTCPMCRALGRVRPSKECPGCVGTPTWSPCSPNDLRRTLGVQLRARGVEPQLIAPMLGHADSRMVEKVYGRLSTAQLEALVAQRISSGPQQAPTPRTLRFPRTASEED